LPRRAVLEEWLLEISEIWKSLEKLLVTLFSDLRNDGEDRRKKRKRAVSMEKSVSALFCNAQTM
jgi:hypothetical protein